MKTYKWPARIQSLTKTVWIFLQALRRELPYYPAVLLPGKDHYNMIYKSQMWKSFRYLLTNK